jgi:hypothetical protein
LRALSIVTAALIVAVANGLIDAQSVPTTYGANSTRATIVEPALPALGSAGFRFNDPSFGSRLLRVTDANTYPGRIGASWVTGSAAHQLAWNATSDKFYVRSVEGYYVPFAFDGTAMTATRITDTGSGNEGLIYSQLEPQFSFVSANVLYGTRQTQNEPTNRPVIRRFDFTTRTYTDILDLGSITPMTGTTYARALASSAAAPEKLSILFGGSRPSADLDYQVAVFQVNAPTTTWAILDSQARTITRPNGVVKPATLPKAMLLHHQWLDMTGRYVLLYPTYSSYPGVPLLPYFIWDLNTDVVTQVTRFPGGHDALGYGWQVNQDCCSFTQQYDGAQWQLRHLSAPAATSDLIVPLLRPEVLLFGEHTSWNNAQPNTLVPVLSSIYRYGNEGVPWRAWDGEVIAIQTNGGSAGGTVWRFAHHRSDITYDGGSGGEPYYFWYLPRAMISPDGRYAMFTSNWEKTLGLSTIDREEGGDFRNDVFIVELARVVVSPPFTDDPLSAGIFVKAVHVTELRTRVDALRARFGLAAYSWTDSALAAGMTIRAAHVNELRVALEQAYSAAPLAPPGFAETIVAGSTVIKASHVQELRAAVVTLEEN